MNFKELLKSKNIKQTEVANKLGVKKTTISMWAKSKSRPKIDMVPKIAELLGVSTDEILSCFNGK